MHHQDYCAEESFTCTTCINKQYCYLSNTMFAKKPVWLLSILILFPCYCYSKISVSPGAADTVSYTHVLFELQWPENSRMCELVLFKHGTTDTIRKSVHSGQVLVDSGLSFGNTYSWMYTCADNNGKPIFTSGVYQLSIIGQDVADTSLYHYKVCVAQKGKYFPALIMLDMGVILDRQGKPVWTFPKGKFGAVRCFDMTNEGNLIFLSDGSGYETDIRGKILWKTPDTIPGYGKADFHHEFKKLFNGNYLCLATYKNIDDDNRVYSLVLEINKNGRVIWCVDERSWYVNDTAFKGSHLNAAYYDESNKELYLSHRDLGSIAKIDVATSKPIYSIGYDYKNGTKYYPHDFFNGQHAVSVTGRNILLFNNNALQNNKSSSIVLLSMPRGKKPPKKLWEYSFNFNDAKYNKVAKQGGVVQLPGGNFLVCMGANSKVLEVNMNKEIVWEMDVLKYNSSKSKFLPIPTGYRGSFTERLYRN